MKSKNWPNYLIASTVVICSLVLLGVLSFALYGFNLKKGGKHLQIEFRDSTGIKLHSPVRYAGALAGKVTAIRYLTMEERRQSKNPRNAVRVTVQLNEDAPDLPGDLVAGLAAETILGEKFIALSAGSPDAPPMVDGATIQGKDVVAFDVLAQSVQSALDRVNQLMGKLSDDYPTLIPRLAALLNQANTLLEQGSEFVQTASGTITNANGIVTEFKTDYGELMTKLDGILAQVHSLTTNADVAVQKAGTFVGRADGLVKNNEDTLRQILHELRVVSQNLKVTTTYTKALTAALGEKPSRLVWGRNKTTLPTEAEILASSNAIPVELPKK